MLHLTTSSNNNALLNDTFDSSSFLFYCLPTLAVTATRRACILRLDGSMDRSISRRDVASSSRSRGLGGFPVQQPQQQQPQMQADELPATTKRSTAESGTTSSSIAAADPELAIKRLAERLPPTLAVHPGGWVR